MDTYDLADDLVTSETDGAPVLSATHQNQTTYRYDAAGNTVETRDRDGRDTTTAFDGDNRVTRSMDITGTSTITTTNQDDPERQHAPDHDTDAGERWLNVDLRHCRHLQRCQLGDQRDGGRGGDDAGLRGLWLRAQDLSLGMRGDEAQHACPRVGGRLGEVGGAPIEEAMWGAGVRYDLVLHAGLSQLVIKRLYLVGWDTLVGASEEPKQRILDAHGAVEHRAGPSEVARQAGVEADDSRESRRSALLRAGQERQRAAHAKADGERGGTRPRRPRP